MRSTTVMFAATLSLACLPALAQDASKAAKLNLTLKICHGVEQSFPWILKNGKGMNIVLLEMLAAKTGAKIEMVGMSWEKCLAGVESGEVAGLVGASYKEDRAKYAMYPMANGKLDSARKIHTDAYNLYKLKGNPLAWDGSKLSNLSGQIGAQKGYSVVGDLKKLGAQVDDSLASADAVMQKLASGKIQGAAMLTYDGEGLLEGSADLASKIETLAPVLVDKPYFLIIGKGFYSKNQEAVEALWSAIPAVRQSSDYRSKLFAISQASKK
jgi:polar amino acid transport system substrate-binding protein